VNVSPYISLLGFSQGALLSSLLLFAPGQWNKARILLIALLSAMTFNLLRVYTINSEYGLMLPQVLTLGLFVSYAIAPLHYLYVKSALRPHERFCQTELWHFLPTFFVFIYFWLFSELDIAAHENLLERFQSGKPLNLLSISGYERLPNILPIASLIQLCIYFFLARKVVEAEVISEKKDLENTFFIRWLEFINCCMLFMIGVIMVSIVYQLFSGNFPAQMLHSIGSVMSTLVILSILFLGIRQLRFSVISAAPSNTSEDALSSGSIIESGVQSKNLDFINDKYKKSGLSGNRTQEIAYKAIEILEENDLYLNNELTLASLAEHIGCTTNHLSQSINSIFEKSFTELVRKLRVEEAKRLLVGSPSTSVLDVAMAAGFNSKSSFYSAFKKETDQTPSSYRSLH